ncbi:MAG: glycoside hydrolase family 32 protein [Bifidobacterium sp.]|uniref:Glycoside hydrolase family 32 protein n=2 Tax=Bifidobacterium fermentum TaxID=3059035 RepID=A0AB39UID2_9BIFI
MRVHKPRFDNGERNIGITQKTRFLHRCSRRMLAAAVCLVTVLSTGVGMSFSSQANAVDAADSVDATGESNSLTKTQFDQFYHYQASQGFMNDIQTIWKGSDGYYHFMYLQNANYRHDDDGTVWYHVKTKDFVHYTNVGVSIPKFNGVWYWMATGSVITNENGFYGDLSKTDLVAYFTSYIDGVQKQFVAYSKNGGRTFEPYRDAAIMSAPDASSNFRDPYISYDARSKTLMMYLAEGDRIGTYSSKDGVAFTEVGDTMLDAEALGGKDLGTIECPNIKTLYDPQTGERKTILFFGANGYQYGQTTGTYYMVGHLDGKNVFVPEQQPKRVDDGSDYYGANFMQQGDAALISLAWMGNWGYSDKTIADENGTAYRLGSLSLAHRLKLRGQAGNYTLDNTFVEPSSLYARAVKGTAYGSRSHRQLLDVTRSTSQNAVLRFSTVSGESRLGGDITVSLTHKDASETIEYSAATGDYSVSRTTTRIQDSGGVYEYTKKITANSGIASPATLTFHIIQDQSSVEFFVQGSGKSYSMARYTTDSKSKITVSSNASVKLSYSLNDIVRSR